MKFKIYKFEEVTSTNDVAIYLIKNKKKNMVSFILRNKQMDVVDMGINGSPTMEIYLDLFFFL
jgi:hypothetical protein